ncbi:MAG: peptidylprolyl isomerase [Desulfocapsaceae bacterium]|nr:peptidylprolyl isomerase [Desulfocapsaceae bacterium]
MILNISSPKSFFITLTVLLGALLSYPVHGTAEMLDRIVAVVNDDIITLSELEESGKEYLDRVQEKAPEEKRKDYMKEARQRVLSKIITERLINQQAATANVKITDVELQRSYQKNLEKIGVSHQEFLRKLEETGLSEERYKTDLRNKLLRDKLILYEVRSKVVVTDEMVKEYYDNQYAEEIAQGGFYLLQMGFSWGESEQVQQSEDLLAADKARARQRAERIRQEVLDGEDFSKLARQESDLPSAEDGGDLGIFQENELAPYMRDAIVNLDVGEISPVIETPNSFQFFKLLSRQDDEESMQAHFETVKDDIRVKLMESKFQEEYKKWVEQIKTGSYIKKML